MILPHTTLGGELLEDAHAPSDGLLSWISSPFTVDGIRYNFLDRGNIMQPMIQVKEISLTEWDSPHMSDAAMLELTREESWVWADLEWNPDIMF